MHTAIERHLRDLQPRRLAFRAGQYLFHLGDPAGSLYLIQSGMVHLVRHQSDGGALVLQRAGPRSVLAEASLYSTKYHCDAVASTQVVALAFPKADFLAQLRKAPAFAEVWAKHLAHELQRARLQTEILSLKTVARRLDARLAWEGGALPPKGGWKTLASEIGVSPEALYREMARRRMTG